MKKKNSDGKGKWPPAWRIIIGVSGRSGLVRRRGATDAAGYDGH